MYLMWKIRQITAKEDTKIDEGRVIRETNALAHVSITDLVEWDEEGHVTIKPSTEIPREVAAAIKKFKSTTLCMANCCSDGNRQVLKAAAMRIPTEIAEINVVGSFIGDS